jgi:arsenate reductase
VFVPEHPYNVLFLCTGNSARSILAERILEHWGAGKFHAYSAGSFPTGRVNPLAIVELQKHNLSADGLRSKSWDEFAAVGAPKMNFIFTVCDQAAGEVCPVWPGQPVTAHWGVQDPAAVEGSEADRMKAFRNAFMILENRIKVFTSLPIEKLDHIALTSRVKEIGQSAIP